MGDEKAENKQTSSTVTHDNKDNKKKGFISRIWNAIFASSRDDFEKRLECITKEENRIFENDITR